MIEKPKEPEIHLILGGEKIEIEVHNVQGQGCTALSKPYADLFQQEQETKKAEFHATVNAGTKQSVRG